MLLYAASDDGTVERLTLPRSAGPVHRVYAIGDVHGRFDLLGALMALIRQDHARRGIVPAAIVLLGDLVDRGPASAALAGWAMRCAAASSRFIVLKGNHEAMMTEALDGDLRTLDFWLRQGGRETLANWGVPAAELDAGAGPNLLRRARRAVGAETLAWLASLPVMAQGEHHLFVHAGIRPGVAIDRQHEDDLLWIRRDFLDSRADHGPLVVHGHTIHAAGPDVHANRVGIDTGAYRTGRLTAMAIEGAEHWFLGTGSEGWERSVAGAW